MNNLIKAVFLSTFFAVIIKRWMEINMISRKPRGVSEILEEISFNISHIERYLRPKGIASVIEFYQLKNGQEVRVTKMELKQGEKALIKLAIKDNGGNPAQVQDGKVEWSQSNPALGELIVAADGMSAEYIPNGTVGDTLVQAKGDADLGEGVKEIVGELKISQLSGEAVIMELSAEAAPKDAAPAAKK